MTDASKLTKRRIIALYNDIRLELGQYAPYMNRSYFYHRIKAVTGLSVRTIQKYLNQPP